MPRASANGIEVEYDTIGNPNGAPLLLISGLGSQLIAWDERFCKTLAGRGFQVIRFDNRDSGLSTKLDHAYTLDDMAADAVGLLDALQIPAAHVVGASMGGFIAQLVVLNHPKRALTLTSIFSGPGGEDEVHPTEQGLSVLLAPPQPTREARIEQALWGRRATAGRLDPFDEEREYVRAARAFDRAYYPAGYTRQWMAIVSAPSRVARLKSLTIPTLVIHGLDDIVIPPENGRVVAAAVPGARLMEIEGMGHQLPERVWAPIADAIAGMSRKAVTTC